jgi:MFS family permease
MQQTRAQDAGKLKMVVRALRSRNYRLFFCGQLVSLVGTWLAQVAMGWLVWRLTHSTIMLGTVAFCTQIPAFLMVPWAGVMVDRWNLRKVLVITQSLMMVNSLTVATLTLTGLIEVKHIIVLAICSGLTAAFDMPSRQAFVVQMIESPEDLPSAIALNSSMFNASRLLGPAAAGVLVAKVGEGVCFLADGLSFLAVIVALLMMRITWGRSTAQRRSVLSEFAEGFRYVKGSVPIRSVLLNLAIVSLAGTPYVVLMPVFATDVLHGTALTQGFLTASIGFGALLAGLHLASRSSVLGLGRLIAAGSLCFGVSLMAFSFSRQIPLSMVLLACCGFSMLTQMASSNTVVQTIVDNDKRGRVMSFYGMSFQGMMPIGSMLAGTLSQTRLGPTWTVFMSGALCMVAGLLFFSRLTEIRRHIRPIYVQRGILPPVTAGLGVAESEVG